jgi:hypothetical protein
VNETERLIAALAPTPEEVVRRSTLEYRQSLELYRAIVCARDLATCIEILERKRVPTSRLDRTWARAYGLRS